MNYWIGMLLGSCWTCFLHDDSDASIVTASATIITLKMESIPQNEFTFETESWNSKEKLWLVSRRKVSAIYILYSPWGNHSGLGRTGMGTMGTGNECNSFSVNRLIPMHQKIITDSKESRSSYDDCVFPKWHTLAHLSLMLSHLSSLEWEGTVS